MPGMAEGRSAFIPSNTSDGNIRNARNRGRPNRRVLERENLGDAAFRCDDTAAMTRRSSIREVTACVLEIIVVQDWTSGVCAPRGTPINLRGVIPGRVYFVCAHGTAGFYGDTLLEARIYC